MIVFFLSSAVAAHLPVLDQKIYDEFNACVHCGLCLPVCPTYQETQDEADSPRGRILMMKAAVDGRVAASDVVFEHLDLCLVCRACEPACPSGVNYHVLIEAVRPQVAAAALGKGKRMRSGALQWLVESVLPFPKRAAAAMGLLKMARKMGLGSLAKKLAPGALGEAMKLLPESGGEVEIASYTAAVGETRGSVVLLRGCVGGMVSGGVNAACVDVLTRNGVDVHLAAAEEEPCCGALAAHANDPAGAREFAMRMVDVLERQGGDAFISPIAGCGAQLKSLDKVLADVPAYAERARRVVAKMRDISEFLVEVGLRVPTGEVRRRVTYHDPCHLAHAQRAGAMPRQILATIPGLEIVPLVESDMCCGAAGTYSLNQPAMAARLGERKVRHIADTGAVELVTANIGCSLQIARHLAAAGIDVPVRHVMEVLAESYFRE